MSKREKILIGLGFLFLGACFYNFEMGKSAGQRGADRWYATHSLVPDPGPSIVDSGIRTNVHHYKSGDCFKINDHDIAEPIPCPVKAVTNGDNSPAITGSGNSIVIKGGDNAHPGIIKGGDKAGDPKAFTYDEQ